jgi:hypothetical protein
MARHYSTKDFFRQIPNALLARYFHARGLFGDLDFSAMKETRPNELFAACFKKQFKRGIFELANPFFLAV